MPDKITPPQAEVPNAATIAAIEEARQGGLPSFDSVAEFMADLNSEE